MKMRLDEYLSEREQIDLPAVVTLIMTGKVLVDGRPETKPGRQVGEKNDIHLKERPRQYPARSAEKLLGAFQSFVAFDIDARIAGKVCVDLGASHGGFTKVLLDRDAARVYAVDVGRGLLDHSIQRSERVTVLDKHNVKSIGASWFDADDLRRLPWFVTCDISFLSLSTVLESLSRFAVEHAITFTGVFLLKPQFEASDKTEKGILRDEALRQDIKMQMQQRAEALHYEVLASADSVLPGRKGNREICFLLAFRNR